MHYFCRALIGREQVFIKCDITVSAGILNREFFVCFSNSISYCLQVKGLSAMTKEALGLTSQTPKTTTVNGNMSDSHATNSLLCIGLCFLFGSLHMNSYSCVSRFMFSFLPL